MATNNQPTQIDRKTLSDRQRVIENPIARGLNLTVSVPETIEIQMVNVSTLDDYEIWLAISSILVSVTSGFLVAYVQDSSKTYLAVITFVCLFLFVLCFWFALRKRTILRKKLKTVKMRVTEVIEDELEPD